MFVILHVLRWFMINFSNSIFLSFSLHRHSLWWEIISRKKKVSGFLHFIWENEERNKIFYVHYKVLETQLDSNVLPALLHVLCIMRNSFIKKVKIWCVQYKLQHAVAFRKLLWILPKDLLFGFIFDIFLSDANYARQKW